MDSIKKAKASIEQVQKDASKAMDELEKATASMSVGNNKARGDAPSTSSTPATSIANTPSTSAAPSTTAQPSVKLPLAVRKNVRDKWETQQPQLEAKISEMLGVPWKVVFDAGYLYSLAEDRFSQESPGQMFAEYIENAINGIRGFLDRFGDDGKDELNSVASAHVILIAPATDPKTYYSGVEISEGSLKVVFGKGYLGSNIGSCMENIDAAVNAAGVASATTGGGAATLDFDAKQGIKKNYDPKIEGLKQQIGKILDTQVFEFTPNFEQNYALIEAWNKAGKTGNVFSSEWQRQLGDTTYAYFQYFTEHLEEDGFGKDEMLQEGFKEAVEKNEVALRVVEKLTKGVYNECIIENGVLYIQTTPDNWNSNVRDPAVGLIDML
ncbi:MAG: hypothetical protein Q9220_006711 [cf. Caloplaca sp. 1 TL-2023]